MFMVFKVLVALVLLGRRTTTQYLVSPDMHGDKQAKIPTECEVVGVGAGCLVAQRSTNQQQACQHYQDIQECCEEGALVGAWGQLVEAAPLALH